MSEFFPITPITSLDFKLRFIEEQVGDRTRVFAEIVASNGRRLAKKKVDNSYRQLVGKQIPPESFSDPFQFLLNCLPLQAPSPPSKRFLEQEPGQSVYDGLPHDRSVSSSSTAMCSSSEPSTSTERPMSFKDLFERELEERSRNPDALKIEGVLKLFDEVLSSIREASTHLRKLSCFICFNFDEVEIRDWVAGHLMIDLKRSGLEVYCSRDIPLGGDIPYFQQRIFDADKVLLVCTREGAFKVKERLQQGQPKGIAAEILTLLNSFESASRGKGTREIGSVVPVYLQGDERADSCLLPLFLGNKGIKDFMTKQHISDWSLAGYERSRQKLIDSSDPITPSYHLELNREHNDIPIASYIYYSFALELNATIRGLPLEYAKRMQRDFIDKACKQLANELTSSQKLEIEAWKNNRRSEYLEEYHRHKRYIEYPLKELAKVVSLSIDEEYKRGVFAESEIFFDDRFYIPTFFVQYNKQSEGKNEVAFERPHPSKTEKTKDDQITIKNLIKIIERPSEENRNRLDNQPGQSQEIARQCNFGIEQNITQKIKNIRAIIYGIEGGGKTMLCRYLTKTQPTLSKSLEVILLVNLRNLGRYSHGDDVYQILATECGFELIDYEIFLKDSDSRAKILLVLDGYDELPLRNANRHPNNILRQLEQLFPHLLITSRPGIVDLVQAPEFEISAFNKESIESFIHQFFEIVSGEESTSKTISSSESEENLQRSLITHPLVANLVQVPINLLILCSLFRDNSNSIIEASHFSLTMLLSEAVDWFFRKYLTERLDTSTSLDRRADIMEQLHLRYHKRIAPLSRFLEHLAYRMTEEDVFSTSQNEIELLLINEEVRLDQLKKLGIFKLRNAGKKGMGRGEFIHAQFQDYFAALYLSRFYLEGRSKKEKAQLLDRGKRKLAKVKFNPRFSTVLPLVAGILSRCQQKQTLELFFSHLLNEPRDLAGDRLLFLEAGCLSQCNDANLLPHYGKFLDECIAYLNRISSPDMVIELFFRYSKLVDQDRIIHFLCMQLGNPSRKSLFIVSLYKIVKTTKYLPDRLLEIFAEMLKKDSALYGKSLVPNIVNMVLANSIILSPIQKNILYDIDACIEKKEVGHRITFSRVRVKNKFLFYRALQSTEDKIRFIESAISSDEIRGRKMILRTVKVLELEVQTGSSLTPVLMNWIVNSLLDNKTYFESLIIEFVKKNPENGTQYIDDLINLLKNTGNKEKYIKYSWESESVILNFLLKVMLTEDVDEKIRLNLLWFFVKTIEDDSKLFTHSRKIKIIKKILFMSRNRNFDNEIKLVVNKFLINFLKNTHLDGFENNFINYLKNKNFIEDSIYSDIIDGLIDRGNELSYFDSRPRLFFRYMESLIGLSFMTNKINNVILNKICKFILEKFHFFLFIECMFSLTGSSIFAKFYENLKSISKRNSENNNELFANIDYELSQIINGEFDFVDQFDFNRFYQPTDDVITKFQPRFQSMVKRTYLHLASMAILRTPRSGWKNDPIHLLSACMMCPGQNEDEEREIDVEMKKMGMIQEFQNIFVLQELVDYTTKIMKYFLFEECLEVSAAVPIENNSFQLIEEIAEKLSFQKALIGARAAYLLTSIVGASLDQNTLGRFIEILKLKASTPNVTYRIAYALKVFIDSGGDVSESLIDGLNSILEYGELGPYSRSSDIAYRALSLIAQKCIIKKSKDILKKTRKLFLCVISDESTLTNKKYDAIKQLVNLKLINDMGTAKKIIDFLMQHFDLFSRVFDNFEQLPEWTSIIEQVVDRHPIFKSIVFKRLEFFIKKKINPIPRVFVIRLMSQIDPVFFCPLMQLKAIEGNPQSYFIAEKMIVSFLLELAESRPQMRREIFGFIETMIREVKDSTFNQGGHMELMAGIQKSFYFEEMSKLLLKHLLESAQDPSRHNQKFAVECLSKMDLEVLVNLFDDEEISSNIPEFYDLIRDICFITRRALFFQDDKLWILDSRQKVSIDKPELRQYLQSLISDSSSCITRAVPCSSSSSLGSQ